MEVSKIPPNVKPKPIKKVNNSVPTWQNSIDDSLQRSIQTPAPSFDSNLLCKLSDKLPAEIKILSLNDLSVHYSQLLPLCVQIVTGFCAANDKDPTIDVDDVYNIHFLKHTELVTIRDISGDHYNIPLYSSLQFGLVYDPRNEKREFASVSEIINTKPLPKVVVAMERYVGHSEKSSVCEGDLLVIQSIHKYRGGLKKSSLKVFCITSSTKKDLQSDCVSRFSTDPQKTKLYISDLMEFAYNPLPCNARLYFEKGKMSLPEHLSLEISTIEEMHTNQSFLVSLDEQKHKKGKQVKVTDLIDIPDHLGVDVHILNPVKAKDRYRRIYEDTVRLLEEYNPSVVQTCVDAPSDDIYVTQAQLLMQCRQGYENVGLKIDRPANIEEYQPLLPSAFDSAPQYEDLDFIQPQVKKVSSTPPIKALPSSHSKESPTHPKPQSYTDGVLLPGYPLKGDDLLSSATCSKSSAVGNSRVVGRNLEPLCQSTSSTSGIPANVTKVLSSLESNISELSKRLQLVENQLTLMATDIRKLKVLNGMDVDHLAESKSILQMTRDDVLRLLDNLNLSQYKEVFRSEMVDGEILSEIDEDVLQQELGMNSKLHRLRLMKYIRECIQ